MGRGTQYTTTCGAMAEQTLLVPGVVCRGAGFASRIDCQNPGVHPLKLPPSLFELRRTRGHPWAELRKAVGLQDKDVSLLCKSQ